MTKTYVKDYTNTFEIKGETIEVTAPQLTLDTSIGTLRESVKLF